MIKALLQFASLCRAGGLRISTAEILDVIRCLEMLDLADEDSFRAALRANFVKDGKDRERFEKIYDLYLHILRNSADDRNRRSLSRHLIEAFDPEAEDPSAIKAFLEFLSGDPSAFLQELQKIMDLNLDEPEVPFSSILPSSRRRALNRGLRELLNAGDSDSPDAERRSLGDLLTERLGIAAQVTGDSPADHHQTFSEKNIDHSRIRNLGELPFSHLSGEEAKEVHLAIERLARKLRDIVAKRYRRKREGIVDIMKTIRRSNRYQGIPMEVRFRRRQKRKPKVVALCDVSYSVWKAVPFMLNILYSVHDCLSRVRSFVFIARMVEVSETMKSHNILAAIDRIMADFKLELPRNPVYFRDEKDRDPDDTDPEISDYGAAFLSFKEEFMDVLDKKTTLIILGDSRTNFLDPRAHLLDEMRDRCRRVIWLNPEPENLWGDTDSAMETYRPFCDEVRPCRNLNELTEFISGFVL